ncbi:NAD(P)-binding protein [Clavulina sp. PMI_390]|nr:NAD(P)-binding protein [Clavulina sp. PMI_390]
MSANVVRPKVLVTDADGYAAAATCVALAQRGYTVVGTVAALQGFVVPILRLRLGAAFIPIVITDPTKEHAFDDIFKAHPDISNVIHMPAPARLAILDPNNIIDPIVAATTNILSTVARDGSNVRRVVMTSSAASLLEYIESPSSFNEVDWKRYSTVYVDKHCRKASIPLIYRESKVISEQAAWNFAATHRAGSNNPVKFDLVTVQPVLCPAPPPPPISDLELPSFELHEHSTDATTVTSHEPLEHDISVHLIHVADTVLAHVLALESSELKGDQEGRKQLKFAEEPEQWPKFRSAAAQSGLDVSLPAGLFDSAIPQMLYEWL